MRRSAVPALIVLGVALAVLAVSSGVQRLREDGGSAEPSVAAGPQSAEVDWRETYGPRGARLVFEVKRIEVLGDGWRVELGVTNDTPVAYEIGDPRATLDRSFGLMLFATGDTTELAQRNREGDLPSVRPASDYEPSLPQILEPRRSWEGTISARGSLVAGSWLRVVFGTLVAVGVTPEGLDERVVWITDHTYRLRP